MRYWFWIALAGAAAYGAATPKPLTIERVAISQYEDGPNVEQGYAFLPGEALFFSFHVSGFKKVGDEGLRVSLSYTLEAEDPAGVPIIEPQSGDVDTNLDPEDKNWTPKVRLTLGIPPFARSGEYTIQIGLRDRVAQTQARGKASFKVKGHDIEPSDKLVVRNFHFYRGEEDKKPLEVAAYRPGDTLWARFDITGYKLGPKNGFEVGYGLAVLRPNGESMFRQPDAATEKQETFYPRRYVPAAMSLNLNKDLRPGQYTLVVLVSDKLGGQTAELSQAFTVE
jgi:hypothetical protein